MKISVRRNTYLWLLLLLGQKLSERKTSNGFWCLDVASDTSLEGSFLTKRHELERPQNRNIFYKNNSQRVVRDLLVPHNGNKSTARNVCELYLPDTLLVFSSVKNSPSELSWVLFIVVKSGTLGAQQSALLSIVGDRNHTVAGVDFQAGKEAQFGSHILRPKLI